MGFGVVLEVRNFAFSRFGTFDFELALLKNKAEIIMNNN